MYVVQNLLMLARYNEFSLFIGTPQSVLYMIVATGIKNLNYC